MMVGFASARRAANSCTEDKDSPCPASRSKASAKALFAEGTPRPRPGLGAVVLRPGLQAAEPQLERVRRRSRGLESPRIGPDLLRGARSSLRTHHVKVSESKRERFCLPHRLLP